MVHLPHLLHLGLSKTKNKIIKKIDMSFLGSLAKGFIRSAVNQVGRDGGKVLSNNVYGNSHSTPINSIGNVSQENFEENSNLLKEKEYPLIKIIYAIILSVCIPVIGSFIVLYRAFVNLKSKQMTMYKLQNQGVYSSDRRFSSGQRYDGSKIVKIPVLIDITEKEKKVKNFKGISYLIISIGVLIMYFIFYKNGDFKNSNEKSVESETLKNNSFNDFTYKIPDSKYEYSIKITSIETESIKNAFLIKEDKYSVETKKDGYKLTLNISITNLYDKEMQNIPFPYSFCITSKNQEFFSNNTIRRKRIGEIIVPKIFDEKQREIKLINSRDYVQDIVSLNFKPNETKNFKLEYESPILNEVKKLILVDFELKENNVDKMENEIKGLIIDTENKKVIGEQKF